MTELEAREKWCPQRQNAAFINGRITVVHAPKIDGKVTNRCIASDCMMWIWCVNPETAMKEGIDESGHCGLSR